MTINNIEKLNRVDWNFSDYNSSKFPADINSLHWYPAAFVPQIPSFLIDGLSKPNDVVLDPFCGSGITIIEASRLRRHFIGIDINPYALNIANAKIQALSDTDEHWYNKAIERFQSVKNIDSIESYCRDNKLEIEMARWFESKTLSELLGIHNAVLFYRKTKYFLILKTIFTSILNKCSSQRDHYTYITDNCYPKEMIYRPAKLLFNEQLFLTKKAVIESKSQFNRVYHDEWIPRSHGFTKLCDSRNMAFLNVNQIDLVVTSPPYLGVNDYTRSMRLSHYYFPEKEFQNAINIEVGARRKRHRSNAYEEYISDMDQVFGEISRVLRPNGYLAIVIGQGRGRVNKENVIDTLLQILKKKYEYQVLFEKKRKIKFRRIQVPGVGNEFIFVLKRG